LVYVLESSAKTRCSAGEMYETSKVSNKKEHPLSLRSSGNRMLGLICSIVKPKYLLRSYYNYPFWTIHRAWQDMPHETRFLIWQCDCFSNTTVTTHFLYKTPWAVNRLFSMLKALRSNGWRINSCYCSWIAPVSQKQRNLAWERASSRSSQKPITFTDYSSPIWNCDYPTIGTSSDPGPFHLQIVHLPHRASSRSALCRHRPWNAYQDSTCVNSR